MPITPKTGSLLHADLHARVSTDGQTLEARQSALTSAGAEKLFAKISGAVTERKALARAISALGPGDIRLARSTRDLLNVLDAVGNAGAGVSRSWAGWLNSSAS